MAYIIKSLKKINFIHFKNAKKNKSMNIDNKIFIFVVILSASIITVDYALIIKFMDMLRNI